MAAQPERGDGCDFPENLYLSLSVDVLAMVLDPRDESIKSIKSPEAMNLLAPIDLLDGPVGYNFANRPRQSVWLSQFGLGQSVLNETFGSSEFDGSTVLSGQVGITDQ